MIAMRPQTAELLTCECGRSFVFIRHCRLLRHASDAALIVASMETTSRCCARRDATAACCPRQDGTDADTYCFASTAHTWWCIQQLLLLNFTNFSKGWSQPH